jgi:uncharacterized heparinase superfamily protein
VTGAHLTATARMAAHLEPGQVAHRARLRLQAAMLHQWPGAGRRVCGGPDPAAAVGWPPGFCPLDSRLAAHWPSPAVLQAGKVRLLGMMGDLAGPAGWRHRDKPLLWRFHLHYWDWAWGLAADPDRVRARTVFARLWRSWQAASPFGRGDAWHPYPAALRAWSWCGLHRDLVSGSDVEPAFIGELAAHAGFLRRHLESDVLGNHLIKDLKALAGLAVFFGDEQRLSWALRRVARQLRDQVLPDGGHYERSPAYHCQVLADLIDIDALLGAAGHAAVPDIGAAIDRMRCWLGGVVGPDGALPMLNDGYPVAEGLIASLGPLSPPGPLVTLPSTGLVRATAGEWHLLADVGAPGPDGLPGHAHAGTLGCLVYVGRTPLLVDTAVSTYEPGAVRDYERSTAAHNTVEVDGANSTEVWGAFRAGRRARVHGVMARTTADGTTAEAGHDGFRGLPGRPYHRRRWTLTGAGLRVDDVVTGRGRHAVAVRWHLPPGSAVEVNAAGAAVRVASTALRVDVAGSGPLTLAVDTGQFAAGFLQRADAPVLTCRMEAALPVWLTTSWRLGRDWPGAAEAEVVDVVKGVA